MDVTRYAVTDVVIETPRYGGAEGVGGWEHDVIGHGLVEIDGDAIVIAIHPRGVMGRLEPKEKRKPTHLLTSRRGMRKERPLDSAWGTSEYLPPMGPNPQTTSARCSVLTPMPPANSPKKLGRLECRGESHRIHFTAGFRER